MALGTFITVSSIAAIAVYGKKLAARMARGNPSQSLTAIVSSGYSSDPIMANFRSHGFCGCVAKPYRVRDLTQTLREHLGLPILTGLPFGHMREKLTLPVGAHCRLESDAEGFRLQLSR